MKNRIPKLTEIEGVNKHQRERCDVCNKRKRPQKLWVIVTNGFYFVCKSCMEKRDEIKML